MKNQLRKQIKTALAQLTDEEKMNQSEIIMQKLENLPMFQSAKTVLMYWSLPNEVNTHAFIEKWFSEKTILLPVTKNNELILKHYSGNDCLTVGGFNICEPATEEFTNYSDIDLCIVPGLAFDKHKNRLGRGKGYYDKFLQQTSFFKIGVCFDVQLVDSIPCDEWDEKMDLILSF